MRTWFFGSHNSHPSHPISALTVSSAHSILVPLATHRPPLPTRDIDTRTIRTGGVPSNVEKEKWRILPVGEVHDQPAALAGGHRRNAPWRSVSGKLRDRRSLSLLLSAG